MNTQIGVEYLHVFLLCPFWTLFHRTYLSNHAMHIPSGMCFFITYFQISFIYSCATSAGEGDFMKQTNSTLDYFSRIDFFSFQKLFDEIPTDSVNHVNVKELNGDYLQKGFRLETLAKEAYTKIAAYDLGDTEKDIFSIQLSSMDKLSDIIHKITRRVVRPLLRNMVAEGDAYHTALLSMVDASFHLRLSFSEDKKKLNGIIKKLDAKEALLQLTVEEDNYPPLIMYGTQLAVHPSNRKNVLLKKGYCITDIGEVIAFLFILSQLKSLIRNVTTMTDEELYKSTEAHNVKRILKKYQESTNHNISALKRSGILVTKGMLIQPSVSHFLRKNFIQVTEISSATVAKQIIHASKKQNAPIPFFLNRSSALDVMCQNFLSMDCICYHDFLHSAKCENGSIGYWGFPFMESSCIFLLLTELLFSLWDTKNIQIQAVSYYRHQSSDYAKSFQQKKNMPAYIIDAMKNSGFNQFFGFVEFDKSIDIEKVKILADDFRQIHDLYFPFVDATKNTIRFRKLGHHRAKGLYYAFAKCLCVDINYPESLLHEFGHLIDFEYGSLSNNWQFSRVRILYKNYMDLVIKTDSDAAKMLLGKTKYRLSYFIEPTEIFARSFELYLVKIKGVCNSLTPPDTELNWQYPTDDTFLAAVKFYFDNLLADMATNAQSA